MTDINVCIALSLLYHINSRGVPLPCVAIPSSVGCGPACSTQTVVLNLEEGLLVPLKQSDAYEQQDTTVLIDPSLTATLDANLTIAMALTALSNCIDALLTTAHKVYSTCCSISHAPACISVPCQRSRQKCCYDCMRVKQLTIVLTLQFCDIACAVDILQRQIQYYSYVYIYHM
jgi:Iron-containing alcohol dehydrogenase